MTKVRIEEDDHLYVGLKNKSQILLPGLCQNEAFIEMTVHLHTIFVCFGKINNFKMISSWKDVRWFPHSITESRRLIAILSIILKICVLRLPFFLILTSFQAFKIYSNNKASSNIEVINTFHFMYNSVKINNRRHTHSPLIFEGVLFHRTVITAKLECCRKAFFLIGMYSLDSV